MTTVTLDRGKMIEWLIAVLNSRSWKDKKGEMIIWVEPDLQKEYISIADVYLEAIGIGDMSFAGYVEKKEIQLMLKMLDELKVKLRKVVVAKEVNIKIIG
mgnify:CR=1 FL=1|jgi:hypothetical protein